MLILSHPSLPLFGVIEPEMSADAVTCTYDSGGARGIRGDGGMMLIAHKMSVWQIAGLMIFRS